MTPPASTTASQQRTPLSRDRVLAAAVDLADREGIEAVTMRGLAAELGVEAMSLYHHVANKQALLDGVVEQILLEIHHRLDGDPGPDASGDWQAAMKHRIMTARSVLLRHKWAPTVIETRQNISLPLMTYMDAVLGIMVAGGFSYDLAHHAMHALGSRALGFAQELFEPDDQDASDADFDALVEHAGDLFPHLVTMLSQISHDDSADDTLGWCDDQTEFEFGIDVLLDGLERRRQTETG